MSQDQRYETPAGVDVAIPCYQYGRFLHDCVTSVLTQDIRALRVLIIDNASTDNSLEVAQQLAAEDPRVEVVAHKRNLGHHASFNEAIDWANSKYFMILCADDLLAPGCLVDAVSIMERHSNVGFTQGRQVALHPGDSVPILASDIRDTPWRIVAGEDLLNKVCRTGVFEFKSCSVMVVRTVVQKIAGYYRPELSYTDDLEMWMRLVCLGSAAMTEAYLAIHRLHGLNRTCSLLWDHSGWLRRCEATFESFFAHEGNSLPEAGRLHQLAKRSLGERAYWSALAHLCRGDAVTCRNLMKDAFRLCPMTAIFPPLNYLFRRGDAVGRIISVASEMVGWPRAPIGPASGWRG
jgi:glycosyltransferase involved in cell wall biosynthesis